MRHVTPIAYFINGVARRSDGIAENESEHIGAIDDGFKVIDLRSVRWIPRAVKARAGLLHIWGSGGRGKEGKVRQIDCRPEGDEKQRCSGIYARHGSYVVKSLTSGFGRVSFS